METKKSIVLYRTRGIGDIIMSFKGLNLLQNYPANIYYIGYGPALELVNRFFPYITTIDIGKNSLYKTYKIVTSKIQGIDDFIDLQMNSRSIALRTLLRLNFRMRIFKWNKRSLNQILVVFASRISTRKFKFVFVRNYKQPSIEEMMTGCVQKCIEFLFNGRQFNAQSADHYKSILKEENNNSRTLIIAPGGSHQAKQAPIELIISIMKIVLENAVSKFNIYLVGDEKDVSLCKEIENLLYGKTDIENLSGKIRLTDLPDVLLKADVLLATDSAISQLGNFLNVPTAVLLGPTIEGFGFAVETENKSIFSAQTFCRPCSRHGSIVCSYNDKKCFNDIDANNVAGFLLKHV